MRGRKLIYLVLSIPLGYVLMCLVAVLFDFMNWPLFNGWAMMHGTFILAWPILTILAFILEMVADNTVRNKKNISN
jgi:hypothetical protein